MRRYRPRDRGSSTNRTLERHLAICLIQMLLLAQGSAESAGASIQLVPFFTRDDRTSDSPNTDRFTCPLQGRWVSEFSAVRPSVFASCGSRLENTTRLQSLVRAWKRVPADRHIPFGMGTSWHMMRRNSQGCARRLFC